MYRTRRARTGALALASLTMLASAGALPQPQNAVVELFTSQGCSSCPPADALAGRLRIDPGVLVLSFHVDYWDALGWRDTFSSRASTERQYAYARTLRESSVFTPQMIVNGAQSVVGSSEGSVQRAVSAAKASAFPVHAELTEQPDGTLNLTLGGPIIPGEVWEVRYVRSAATKIGRGENGGRTLETYNNVTHIERLGPFKPGMRALAALKGRDDGLAVLVQGPGLGRILGAVWYERHSG